MMYSLMWVDCLKKRRGGPGGGGAPTAFNTVPGSKKMGRNSSIGERRGPIANGLIR